MVWVRSGGFFGGDYPPDASPLSTALTLLLVGVSVIIAAIFSIPALLMRVFFLALGW